jgi:alkylation response protein AidB-like acyl-CoA dehydrogenase
VLGAWGLTEATAGSDAAGMRTMAVRDGDDWVINGAKTFITHGSVGGVMVVMAVTDRTKGHRGISAFVVEHGTPGMRAGKKENKLGMRASDTSEVIFEDCRVPADAAARRGRAGLHQHAAGARRRAHRHRGAVGRARAGAYEAARATRRSAASSGSRSPRSRRSSGSWPTTRRASRRRAADVPRGVPEGPGRRTTRESSMAKLYASEIAVRAAEDCVQIHGGYGFVKDYPAEKFFRDVKLTTIGEGTSEIQRLVIARQLLGT